MVQEYKFYTDTVSVKTTVDEDGVRQHYIEGYISTSDLDRVGDIVTKDCLKDMVAQIKGGNIKLDVEHEAWTKGSNIIPVGKIVDAKLDEKGIWVKAVINQHIERFKEVWMSIKGGFLDAFSIAYKAVKEKTSKLGEKTVRLLDKVELLNVALTGNPANPECRIANVMTKSLQNLKEEKTMADEEMKSEEVVETTEDAPAVEEKSIDLTAELESLRAEIKSIKENSDAEVAEIKSQREEQDKLVAELKARLEAAEEAMAKPQIKAEVKEDVVVEEAPEGPETPLAMIQ